MDKSIMNKIEIKKYRVKFAKEEDDPTESEYEKSESLDSGPEMRGDDSD